MLNFNNKNSFKFFHCKSCHVNEIVKCMMQQRHPDSTPRLHELVFLLRISLFRTNATLKERRRESPTSSMNDMNKDNTYVRIRRLCSVLKSSDSQSHEFLAHANLRHGHCNINGYEMRVARWNLFPAD